MNNNTGTAKRLGKVIAVSNGKGGCGKTTTSVNLACCLAMRNDKVLLVDADPIQGTATDFISLNNIEFEGHNTKMLDATRVNEIDLTRLIHQKKEQYDYIIIDTAPRIDKALAKLLKISDTVIISCIASNVDVWASEPLLRGLQAPSCANKKYAYLFNSNISQSTLYEESCEEVNELVKARCLDMPPILKNHTMTRASYRRSTGSGKPVIHLNDAKAASEMELITNEILGL